MSDNELRELQAENERLRRRLHRAGVVELPPVELPTDEQLDALIKMVVSQYPRLEPVDRAQVVDAMAYLAFAYRPDKLSTQYATHFWLDAYKEFATNQGFDSTAMTLKAFTVAAIASGVAYSPISEFPYISFGLSLGSAGRPSTAWRDVLANGIRPPAELKNRAPQPRVIETDILSAGARERIRW